MNGQTDKIWSSPIHRKDFLRRGKNVHPKVSTNLKTVFSKGKKLRLISKPNYGVKKQLLSYPETAY